MEKYIAILKTYKDFLQFLHWNTGKDYARHLLYERLMGEVDDPLDRFVEVMMGSDTEVVANYEEFKEEKIDITDIRTYLMWAKGEFQALLPALNEACQNVVVDIIEMIDRHLYLL